PAATRPCTLCLDDALPISGFFLLAAGQDVPFEEVDHRPVHETQVARVAAVVEERSVDDATERPQPGKEPRHLTMRIEPVTHGLQDRKSTRLNSSHVKISNA